ncbi:phosphotransferase family protein [Nocardia farcinica]|uniref:phosphotransferase family protein n=1 Tax=Nocardia farcinica TaxID=37329 RepID=UPI001895D165|nr:phosphotransferase family protein [Nocardia farcinica]MBF6230406.1 phosphotransferase family protein [Nocardia farcinica]MBF6521464.1 phosphotransferase family protein [Nocardia farcinica]
MSADPAAGLADVLAETFGAPVRVRDLEFLSAGARRRNVAFTAEVEGQAPRTLVATLVPAAVEIMSVSVEAAVRELARGNGVPVPEVVAVCADPARVGEPFLISAHVAGETVPRKVLRLIAAEGTADRVAGQWGEAMGRLHAVDPGRAPEALPAAGADPAADALADAEKGVRALLADRPVFAMALRWLERRLPAPPPRTALLHTDLRNGNIVVGADGLRAVLDWEGAQRFGDPMRDVAWPALRMWRFREDAREFGGFADRDTFVRGYEAAGGSFDLDRFRWWKVMGTLAWGVGLAGQAAAHLDGTVRDIVMAASGRRVSEIEWDLLMQIRPAARA